MAAKTGRGKPIGPVAAGDRCVRHDAARAGHARGRSGDAAKSPPAAQLPQGTQWRAAVRQTRVYQLGEHSTLFVLDANSLACSETVYLGHQAGEILVPPVAVLDQVLDGE